MQQWLLPAAGDRIPGSLSLRARPLGEGRHSRLGTQRLGELGTRVDPELGEDLTQVVLDGVLADEEARADLRIREAVASEAGYLRLLDREVVSRLQGAFAGV